MRIELNRPYWDPRIPRIVVPRVEVNPQLYRVETSEGEKWYGLEELSACEPIVLQPHQARQLRIEADFIDTLFERAGHRSLERNIPPSPNKS